jgi:mono/diheme cytochrome c family protein
MFALDDGDLEGAANAAKWLARHPAVDRIPDDWLPYLEAMRAASRAVENAADIDAARDAAERISVHCQECHAAAGILSTD